MVQQPVAPAGDISDQLSSLPFRSLLPTLDALLAILHDQSVSETPPSSVESSEQVAAKARELASALEEMKKTAMTLPGADLSIDQIKQMSEFLEEQAGIRRDILNRFGQTSMPTVDDLGGRSNVVMAGDESRLPTPIGEA